MTTVVNLHKFKISSGSLTPKVSFLYTAEETKEEARKNRAPIVYYAPDVFEALDYIIAKCTKEVGWLGTVKVMDSGDYLIDRIFVPEQTVTGAETDILPEAMLALANEIIESGDDPSRLYYWGHSHVNMGVAPSGQDERQIEEYLDSCPVFIRGIYNKKGDSKVDVYDTTKKRIYESVYNDVFTPPIAKATKDHLDKLVAANVKERVYADYSHTYYGGNSRGKKWDPQLRMMVDIDLPEKEKTPPVIKEGADVGGQTTRKKVADLTPTEKVQLKMRCSESFNVPFSSVDEDDMQTLLNWESEAYQS